MLSEPCVFLCINGGYPEAQPMADRAITVTSPGPVSAALPAFSYVQRELEREQPFRDGRTGSPR
jgi:hypothetical protein